MNLCYKKWVLNGRYVYTFETYCRTEEGKILNLNWNSCLASYGSSFSYTFTNNDPFTNKTVKKYLLCLFFILEIF